MPVKELRPIRWADKVSQVYSPTGASIFQECKLEWSIPTIWKRDEQLPALDCDSPCLYALIRNHGRSKTKDHIEYIGLTMNPKTRFANHETATQIVQQRGEVKLSYAPITFVKGRNKLMRTKDALEQIEHLLIWALDIDLWNDRKVLTLPGLGKNGGTAWDIRNSGYRFCGRMPLRIVYPWMVVRRGRDRSVKAD